MSLCDTCPVPGSCCRHIVLGDGRFGEDCETVGEAEAFIRGSHDGSNGDEIIVSGPPMPFHPLFKRATEGAWVWWCPNLNRKTGRCDDYANRPLCCSNYKPKTDELCVLYEPA